MREDAPPPGYSLATEVAGVARVADEAGFARFHLFGYSGGGAASLAFAARNPERLLSLALAEPAFAGWAEWVRRERTHFDQIPAAPRPRRRGADGPLPGAAACAGRPAESSPPGSPASRGWRSGRPGFEHC